MTKLAWDAVGERQYETGVDRGVLYIPNVSGVYNDGVAWNGLVSVTESPSGAEANAQYADNTKYLNLLSAEQFGGTLEAFTYPDEFAQFDGQAVPVAGVAVGQQGRKSFGLSYRTKVGNDVDGDDAGYKLHLVYGCTASPSEKAYTTVNDSPEGVTFSWTLTTVPVPVTGLKSTSLITVDSTKVSATALAALEDLLYGTVGTDPSLPTPDAVIALFEGAALASGVAVAGGVDSVTITGTTADYLFTLEVWDGDSWNAVPNGTGVTEAAAEGLTLVTGSIYRVTLSAADGHYVPAAQQKLFIVSPT